MTIDATLAAVATVVRTVSGIRQVAEPPNETQNVSPFAVVYFASGVIAAEPIGAKKNLFSVAIDLLIPRTDLARDINTLTPFLDSIPAALLTQVSGAGALFAGNIQTFARVSIGFLPQVDYAGVQMIGYRFLMEDVKLLVSL